MIPKTTFLWLGTNLNGAKSPERSSSYSNKYLSTFISLNKISATGSYVMTLNISDLALNDLSGVNMSLTIIS